MKKTLLLCGVLLALAAPAFAQPYPPQINLTWSDCPLGVFQIDMTNTCTSNSGIVGGMIASFVPPGALPQYEANVGLFDLQTSAATLSPWWNMSSSGCRPTGLSLDANFISGPFGCSDFWAGQASTGMQYNVPGVLGPNSARINAVAGVQETQAGLIDENSMWYAYRLTLSKTKTVGATGCTGCLDGACIVLNQMNLSQPAPAPDVVLTNGPQQWVTYRGGAGAGHVCPGATPTHKSTWGSVKALYR